MYWLTGTAVLLLVLANVISLALWAKYIFPDQAL